MSGVCVELRPSRVQRYTLDLEKTYIKRIISVAAAPKKGRDGFFVVFGSTGGVVVDRSGPNFLVILGNDPLTIMQSYGPLAQSITCAAHIIPRTMWCETEWSN